MPKGADCAHRSARHGLQPPPTPRGLGDPKRAATCHPGRPGRADRAASDPTSRAVQLLTTTKQNKGARRGRGLGVLQSPPRPPARAPGSPLATDQGPLPPGGLLSPRGRPVTGAPGTQARGSRGWGSQMAASLPPPLHPCLGARGPAALRRGPARPGAPRGTAAFV